MDIKKELVEKLEKDCKVILNEKLTKALESNNEGTYRNLTRALETNLELIEKYSSQDFKDIVIKNLCDVKLLNENGDTVHEVDFVTNVEICHIDISHGELRGRRTRGNTPTELINKKYKLVSNGKLGNIFNNKIYDFELVIDSVELLRQARNDELIFKMFAVGENPLYTIKVEVR